MIFLKHFHVFAHQACLSCSIKNCIHVSRETMLYEPFEESKVWVNGLSAGDKHLSGFIKNILICVSMTNVSLVSLERYEDENDDGKVLVELTFNGGTEMFED